MAATDRNIPALMVRCLKFAIGATAMTLTVAPLKAAVLPEDRADILYHSYSGGGVTISGPAVLVRKKLKDKYSLSAKYYVDNVSSASIDVVTTASRYSEKRVETSVGLDTIQDKTSYSLNYISSSESDYNADSAHLDVSHDFFGDLTTVSLGFSQGWDTVGKNHDANWVDRKVDRRNYRMGLSQILTKNAIMNLSFESIIDEGSDNRALGNPYRSVRIFDTANNAYSFDSERYPTTRNSDAISAKFRYALESKNVVFSEYRQYTDSWGINGWHVQVGYIMPIEPEWLIETRFRHYAQTHADFYSDLLPDTNFNFYARDKELSTFTSNSIGATASYERKAPSNWFVSRGKVSFMWDYFMFDYDDFRDARKTSADVTPGSEPLYHFNANVYRLLFTAFY